MIKASERIEEALSFLTEESKKSDLNLQKARLSSTDYNKTMGTIEEKLNLLYEKARTLEETIDYAKAYIEREIDDKERKIEETIYQIEQVRDANVESIGGFTPVPLAGISRTYIDRDGSLLPEALVKDGRVVMPTLAESRERPALTSSKKHVENYSDNAGEWEKTSRYHSVYLLEGAASNGVTETLVFSLGEAKEINMIDFRENGGKVVGITLINENGVREALPVDKRRGFSKRKLIGFELLMTANDFETAEVFYDKERASEDYWTIQKKDIYELSIGRMSMSGLLEKSGLEGAKKDYAQYLDELEEWRLGNTSVKPAFSSRLERKTWFTYSLGIENVTAGKATYASDAFIEIGPVRVREGAQLSIEVKDSTGKLSSIEYSIVDKHKELAPFPVLPSRQNGPSNEKVFYEMPLRFDADKEGKYKVMINGKATGYKLEEAPLLSEKGVTVSYKSVSEQRRVSADEVCVIAIMRSQDESDLPSIESVAIVEARDRE